MSGAFSLLYSMRLYVMSLLLLVSGFAANAQFRKIVKTPSTENHFRISGVIYHHDILSGNEVPAAHTQIAIYQNKELYVAFFGGADGLYSFFLPVGFEYEIWFGGSAFANKKLFVDATQLPEEKRPRDVTMDVSLFRAVEGVDFSILEEPFVRMAYEPESDQMKMDDEYTRKRKTELDKQIKKAKKLLQSAKG
jgi:hypothetical protein